MPSRVGAGYGEPGFLASYLGVQAHGILWPAPGAPASASWPIAPPMVSAKVRSENLCSTHLPVAQLITTLSECDW